MGTDTMPGCNCAPKDPGDKAQRVMTSDHYFSKTDLKGILARCNHCRIGRGYLYNYEICDEMTLNTFCSEASNQRRWRPAGRVAEFRSPGPKRQCARSNLLEDK